MNLLILTGSFGMGHNAAAAAIAESIIAERNGTKVYVEDLFNKTLKSQKYNLPFGLMVKYGKGLYNFVYRNSQDAELFKRLPFHRYLLHCLQELIDQSGADVIVSTLPYCSKIVSEYKRSRRSAIPLITCITDVSSHCEWLHPHTDYYLVAAPQLKDELVRKGVEARRVLVSGIPVRAEFQKDGERTGTRPERRLLMMGGGLGLLPKAKGFYEGLNRLHGVRTTVITGKNVKLYKALAGKYENIEVLAYVQDVSRHMKGADLLLSKPGGITLFEAIAAELPLLLFPPFLQHEFKNGEFILANRIGAMLPGNPKAWVRAIRDILREEDGRARMRENMRSLKAELDASALIRVLERYGRQCA